MSLFPKFQFRRNTPANPANPANPEAENTEIRNFCNFRNPPALDQTISEQPDQTSDNTLLIDPDQEEEALKALASTTATTAGVPVEASTAVTEPLPTRIEIPEPAPLEPPSPRDRLCYECQYFQRSPYGYPLGLCQHHGNRIQHSTSQPTQFGCGEFVFRQLSDDTRTCLTCRHYSDMSTMCSVVNTGCPYPSIPPCSGEKFQHRLKAVNTNKEARDHNNRPK